MNRPIRVLMLIQAYYPLIGGAEKQIQALAPLLRERNVEVHILTRPVANRPSYEEVEGIPVYRTLKLPLSNLTTAAYTLHGLAYIHRLRPDVLHAHGLFSPTTTAMIAKRLYGMPVLAKILRGGVLGDVIRVKNKAMGKQRLADYAKSVDGFITLSNEIQGELEAEGMPSSKLHFIPNGVDTERFKPLTPQEKQAQRTAMGFRDEKIVVYSGRLVIEKRVHLLIENWSRIQEQFPNTRLLVVGEGPEETRLHKMVTGDKIQFLGAQEDVSPWLQIADIYVLPSISEGLSNSLLEAMSTGLAIVATAVGDTPTLIKTDINGWCIPPDDADALVDAILASLGNAETRQMMGEKNRKHIIENYPLFGTADKLRNLYELVTMPNTSST